MAFPPKRILVPTDFSAQADEAMRYAFALSASTGAQVDVVHGYHFPSYTEAPIVLERILSEVHQDADARLKTLVEPYKASDKLGKVVLLMGDARDVIVQTARERQTDLIIMGSHGRRGLQRVLLGSVAEAVMRLAPCPVLVVRPVEPSSTKG